MKNDPPVILAVDDNPENLSFLFDLLDRANFKILVAQDGESALKRAENTQPDMILLDVVMPRLDGFETCQRLKTNEKTKRIPVIFMTALGNLAQKVKGLELGAVDYITKPIQPQEVLARIRTHLTIQQLQNSLRAKNEELQESLETLRRTQDQLVQSKKMAALGNLVAGVAHEINTPVGVGVTAASYLEQKTCEFETLYYEGRMKRSDLEKYMRIASDSTRMTLSNLRRAADLIRSFKQVAVDQTSGDRRTFQLKAYLDEVLLSLHPKLKKTKHTVRLTCPEDIELDSYPGAFAQIIANLVMNSLIHGFEWIEYGEITLDISQEDDTLVFRYSDNGKGIPEDRLKEIFDPFYTTKRSQGGSGLGLHIVYNLVTRTLGGQIKCESTPGAGTTFIIRMHNK